MRDEIRDAVTRRDQEQHPHGDDEAPAEVTSGAERPTTKVRAKKKKQRHLEHRQNSEPIATGVGACTKCKHSNGRAPKGADVCKNFGKTGFWVTTCRGAGGGAENSSKGESGKEKGKCKGSALAPIVDNCRNCGKFGHKEETCSSTSS